MHVFVVQYSCSLLLLLLLLFIAFQLALLLLLLLLQLWVFRETSEETKAEAYACIANISIGIVWGIYDCGWEKAGEFRGVADQQ